MDTPAPFTAFQRPFCAYCYNEWMAQHVSRLEPCVITVVP